MTKTPEIISLPKIFLISPKRIFPCNCRDCSCIEPDAHHLANIIAKFGMVFPIIIHQNYDIFSGHDRLAAAKAADIPLIPVAVKEYLEYYELEALLAAEERLHKLHEWNKHKFVEEFDFWETPGNLSDLALEDI